MGGKAWVGYRKMGEERGRFVSKATLDDMKFDDSLLLLALCSIILTGFSILHT